MVDHGDARGVISAILEALEPADEDRDDVLGTDVADDAAHREVRDQGSGHRKQQMRRPA